jgi:AraC-like DNA-binding protein
MAKLAAARLQEANGPAVVPGRGALGRPTGPASAGHMHLGVAKEIFSVLAELGADPEQVIAEAGLDPRLFADGANLISVSALGRLLTLCVGRTNCPHFGLLVGQKASLASLRLVGSLMRHSPTVGEALRNLERHLPVQNRGAVVRLDVHDEVAILSYCPYDPGVESAAQQAEGALATTVNALRALCGPEWAPSEVLLPRAAPVNQEPYRRFFRAPLRFDQEVAAVVFPARWLEQPIAGADPVLQRLLQERVSELEAASGPNLSDELRRVLRIELTRMQCSAAYVAGRFSIHRRTLNRRLSAEGSGFKALAGEVRFEIARQLLADTTLSIAQVSAVLEYSEPAAFTRAFQRWSGATPSAWRAQQRALSDASQPGVLSPRLALIPSSPSED